MGGQYMTFVTNSTGIDIKVAVNIQVPGKPSAQSIVIIKANGKNRFQNGSKDSGKVTVGVYKELGSTQLVVQRSQPCDTSFIIKLQNNNFIIERAKYGSVDVSDY